MVIADNLYGTAALSRPHWPRWGGPFPAREGLQARQALSAKADVGGVGGPARSGVCVCCSGPPGQVSREWPTGPRGTLAWEGGSGRGWAEGRPREGAQGGHAMGLCIKGL